MTLNFFAPHRGYAADRERVADTGLESPHDVSEPGEEPTLASNGYRVAARSVVVLRRDPGGPPSSESMAWPT
jgi:hypothetical protein